MPDKNLNFSGSVDFEFVFESYGVQVKIQTSSRQLLDNAEKVARKALLGRVTVLEGVDAEHTFGIADDDDTETLYLFKDGARVSYDTSVARFYKFFDSLLRITVAEHAVDRVFIHAGVVGCRGRAVVIPASSFRGKTTLVAELVKRGA